MERERAEMHTDLKKSNKVDTRIMRMNKVFKK